ncbi:hypothetical protein H072_6153 [Dactylellina haptotyla CBS 200.50]|uniref:RBR-type E3 ubiquitin transferase n=1 Tax=Dactylellina haptotyla (strain CBS 200.50) TaxID=1284197 RepID=S8BXI9_DACHA|nr:hypothetical protein H072_6153 [Dactylellina haptotyla CBS 200.50]
MRARTVRASLLSKDPTTAAEAGQLIHTLAASIGWVKERKGPQRRSAYLFAKEKHAKCTICGDTFLGFELERLNCLHRHCRDCLQRNFQYTIGNPDSFPAKCCKSLPLSETSHVLSDEEMKAALAMQEAYEASKVISCFSCQGDIFLSDISRDAAYCLQCHKLTCTTCKKEMHADLCPEDPETDALKSLAKEEGWTQCPKCNRIIHRTAGCNSMTCLCKTNFCFRCGNAFPCKCFTIPHNETERSGKSRADIGFGAAFSNGSSSRKASYKERLNYRILRDYQRSALMNQVNQKLKLKDLKIRRQLKVKEIEVAKEIMRLRVKMNELSASERVEKKELRLKAIENGEVGPSAARVIVTRRNIYSWNTKPIPVEDTRPVSRRTRSQRVTEVAA